VPDGYVGFASPQISDFIRSDDLDVDSGSHFPHPFDNRAITLSATNGYGAATTNVTVVGFFGARQIAARGRGRGQACGKSVKVNSPRSSPTPG
jgi:hypothetical protein